MMSRDGHLDWCKQRSLQHLNSGDAAGAVASMISDLGKWEKPLYDPAVFRTLVMDGIMFRKTAADVQNWIEGFN